MIFYYIMFVLNIYPPISNNLFYQNEQFYLEIRLYMYTCKDTVGFLCIIPFF